VNTGDVQVNGEATPEEVAAILAALHARQRRESDASRFERWRRQRQEVLRDNP
jgi:anthranilate phosphoribosyltransferase